MADDTEQQAQQQQPAYPFFQVSHEGLRRLHEAYGRLIHLDIERSVLADEQAKLIEQARTLQAATRQFTAKHTGDGCGSDEAEASDPTPIKSAGRARGG